jgi:serine/threonine protein kinase
MPALYTCPAGHQWRNDHGGPPVCPRCRAFAVSFTLAADGLTAADAPLARAPDLPTIIQPRPPAPPPPPADAASVPGYKLLREVGRGGMGVVYKARQLGLNRIVALKMSHLQADEHELARFRIEAEAVARLDHPHVVRVHDFGEHRGVPFFSMEFIDGGSLADRLKRGPLPPRPPARLVERLARAMHYAHLRRIIHRDLKPANVLLVGGGEPRAPDGPDGTSPEEPGTKDERNPLSPVHGALFPKVADFGLAKRLDDDAGLTVTDAVLGTASYMAPEQAGGKTKEVGPAADVYALGAVLYECLTGRPPFRAATRDLTLIQVQCDEPTRPTQLRPDLSEELEAVCLKCLEKEPGKRYASAAALADDLRRFLAGEAPEVRPLSEWERQVRWGRRAGYELLELSGCSALGLVYQARQLSLDRPVILKTVSPRAQTDPDKMARFRYEAAAAAKLTHPNIVQVYDCGEHAGQSYLALEFVDGGTLADLAGELPLAPRRAAELVEALARAAHCAHQKGIVHSDLRPFNVQLTADGVPKVRGFGMAQLLEEEWRGTAAGARSKAFSNYMAPEQAAGATRVGPAADIHALGAMLYELLTGTPPFLADTVRETLDRIRRDEPEPPARLRPDVPHRLEVVCLRCLIKDPDGRYPDAAALAAALRGFLAHEQTKTDEFELIPGYELLEELGRGGTGVVYRARQLKLDRLVALKIFRTDLARALAANRAVARLSHPNLVHVYDCGEREGVLYVAEELVDGESLARKAARGPLPPAEAARLVETLARVLHFVHRHGVVHRNLKPSVVLVTVQGEPKVSSFDLARLLPPHPEVPEAEGEIIGTPKYMPPEQAMGRGRTVGPSADVYGLGGILYELLTGRAPFTSANPFDLLLELVEQEPQAPRELRPDVPARLEAVCLKCLRKDPGERYTSAEALADDLHGFLSLARPQRPGFWERFKRWMTGPAPPGHGGANRPGGRV